MNCSAVASVASFSSAKAISRYVIGDAAVGSCERSVSTRYAGTDDDPGGTDPLGFGGGVEGWVAGSGVDSTAGGATDGTLAGDGATAGGGTDGTLAGGGTDGATAGGGAEGTAAAGGTGGAEGSVGTDSACGDDPRASVCRKLAAPEDPNIIVWASGRRPAGAGADTAMDGGGVDGARLGEFVGVPACPSVTGASFGARFSK